MTDELIIKDLRVTIEDKEILKGVNLVVKRGEVVAMMGPNGSGKSTLAYVLMGHPKYKVTSGKILYKGEDITEFEPDERARRGLFLSFQYPQEVPGVTMTNFLRTAYNSVKGKKIPVMEFQKLLKEKMALLKMDPSFTTRYLNEGFSGGEKKRAEILQMAVLQPEIAILDETDSGLDITSLRIVGEGVTSMMNPNLGILIITHYQRMLEYIKPDKVYVLVKGKVTREGGPELAHEIEKHGYKEMEM